MQHILCTLHIAIFSEISLFKWISCIKNIFHLITELIVFFILDFFCPLFTDIGDWFLITTTALAYSLLLIRVFWRSPKRQPCPISPNYFCNWICSLCFSVSFYFFLNAAVCSCSYCAFVRQPSADGNTLACSAHINFPEHTSPAFC